MKKIDLNLDFDAIRDRIFNAISRIDISEMYKNTGISPQIKGNVHGVKKQRPSLEYIIAVARHTKKPIEHFLYGEDSGTQDATTSQRKEIDQPFEGGESMDKDAEIRLLSRSIARYERLLEGVEKELEAYRKTNAASK